MRWQRVAQASIVLVVAGFVALLASSLRRQPQAPQHSPPPRAAPGAPFENTGGGKQEATDPTGKAQWSVKFGTQIVRPDGRSQLAGGVEATIHRGDRQFLVTARDAEVTPAPEGVIGIEKAVFRQDVHLTGAGGLDMKTSEATYTQQDGLLNIPGQLEFAKGRMTGSGSGATYDQNRDVFWMREKAQIEVAPDKDGSGSLQATARSIGIAQMDHYIRLEREARIVGDGRTTVANDITIRLSEDDTRVQMLELRGNSSITETGGGSQSMAARDIDVTYAADGRTLQRARLVENAVVHLSGRATAPGKRIAGNTIDMTLGPDGSTLTSLSATERVQLDLPAEGEGPTKRIRSTSLSSTGAEGTGLQSATFTGNVEYRETRAARRNLTALDRTARSATLAVETTPGLGAIQKADFRGNVTFIEGLDFVAEARQAIYVVSQNRLELLSAEGQPGPASPTVTDGKVSVAARTIAVALSTRDMSADTAVRSTLQPTRTRNGRGDATRKLPSLLSNDEPVNVTSNRLEYKGTASAVYSGDVKLWQGADTTIKAATMSIDDKSGNLTATGGAQTSFLVEDSDHKTGVRTRTPMIGKAETFGYHDAKRLATYEGNARLSGPQGDLGGEKIELFMKTGSNELERLEAYGDNGKVHVQEGPRLARGSHLTYTASDDQYLMIGTPVEVTEEKNGVCTLTVGATVTFNRTTQNASVEGSAGGKIPMRAETLKACPPGLIR